MKFKQPKMNVTTKRIAIFLTIVAIIVGLRQFHVSATRPAADDNTSVEMLRAQQALEVSMPNDIVEPASSGDTNVRTIAYQESAFDQSTSGAVIWNDSAMEPTSEINTRNDSGNRITWDSEPVADPDLNGVSTQILPAQVEAAVEQAQQVHIESVPVKEISPFEQALIEQARASRMAFQSGSNVIPPRLAQREELLDVANDFSSSTLAGDALLPEMEPLPIQAPVVDPPLADLPVVDPNAPPTPETNYVPVDQRADIEPLEFAPPSKAKKTAEPVEPSAIEVPSFEDSESGGYPLDSRDAKLTGPEPSILRQPKSTTPKTAPKTKAKTKAKKKVAGGPTAALKAGDFLPASQPILGAHYKDDKPLTDRRAYLVDSEIKDFSPDPVDPYQPYDPGRQMQVYEGKKLNANQRPLIELGRPWYQLGQLDESSTIMGAHNPISPQFIIFGDSRTAYATTTQNGETNSQIASELNLFWNLQLTGTERFHMFMAPLDNGAKNSRYLFDEDRFDSEFDMDVDFGYFEGDLGAMVGGFIGETLPFDLPFAVGVMPLLVQNGVWMEDAFLGVAATIPARNSARLGISNMDVTFFAGFDEIISPAFEGEDDAAKMWGVMSFIEATNGYWEIDYAFLEDRTARDRSYHNIGIGFTRRYGRFLSNSTRMIVNAGQSSAQGDNTADGVLLLSENSLITGVPSSIVPYFNMWAGFDRPQSAARAGGAGGVLRNTGILFESDGMTGFPTLDATAQDTFGGAIGLNIMPNDWSQQLVLETAFLSVMGNANGRNAQDEQYGVGFRYQLPISNATILRADGMFGFLRSQDDVHGLRMELRRKF